MAIHIWVYTAFWVVHIKRLDMQVLLYPFDVRFHTPSFPVKFCDGKCWQVEAVCDETVNIACRIILINNHSHHIRIPFGSFNASESDILVVYDSRVPVVNTNILLRISVKPVLRQI